MAVHCRQLSMCSDWMSAQWLLGVTEPDSIVRSVQQAIIEQGQLSLTHVQADEIRGQRQKGDFLDGFSNGSELPPVACWHRLMQHEIRSSLMKVNYKQAHHQIK